MNWNTTEREKTSNGSNPQQSVKVGNTVLYHNSLYGFWASSFYWLHRIRFFLQTKLMKPILKFCFISTV